MAISFHPICGMQVGIEFTDSTVNEFEVSYILIDLLILRIQCAWYKNL